MRYKKTDFQIVVENGIFSINVRKPFFWFFSHWVPLTYQENELSEEKALEFESFEKAENFIDLLAD